MKTLSIHTVRNLFVFVVIAGLGYAAYVTNPSSVKTQKAEAAGGDLAGWAWSLGTKMGTEPADNPAGPYSITAGSNPGIGWISFNCTNTSTCATHPYKVSIDASGNFTGYAWANPRDTVAGTDNIGWIMFDPVGPYPEVPNHGARLEADNTVTGWARACAGTVNGDCTGASRTDGWDGWIKLSGMTTGGTPTPYGVSFNPSNGRFTGYAWGSDVVGWIDFSPSVGGTFTGATCTTCATPVTVTISATSPVVTGNKATITWTTSPLTSCTASGSWFGPKGSSGSEQTVNLSPAGTYAYRLDCGAGFNVATVIVNDAPAVTKPKYQQF